MAYPIRNSQFLSLEEHIQVCEDIDVLDNCLTPSKIDIVEYFDLEEDEENLNTKVTFYDVNENEVCCVNVEDYDTVVTYLENEFDIDEIGD